MATYTGASDKYSAFALLQLVVDNKDFKAELDKTKQNFNEFTKKLFYIGQNLETIGRSLTAPFAASATVFADFDDKMRRVSAVTGAGEAAMSSMTDVAKQLGATTAFTASQVAQGMGALGMMGFSSSEIESAISQVMNLSTVTGTELAEASSIAANQLRVFKMDASETGNVVDILAATANGSAQTLTELGEALSKAAPFAAQAGGTLKETSAALGVLANMGIRGSVAGTALAKSYKQMADPKIQAIMRTAYGVEATDGAGNLRNMAEIWADLGKKLSTMGSADQLAAITDIFGDRGALGGGQLTFNPKSIDDFMQKLSKCQGYASSAAKEMEGGLGGAFRSFQSAVEAVKIAIGDELSPTLAVLTKAAAAIFRGFASLVSAFGEAIPVLAVLSGGILAVGVAMKTAAVAASIWNAIQNSQILSSLKVAKAYLAQASNLVSLKVAEISAAASHGILAAATTALTIVTHGLTAAFKAAWAAIAAHPLVAITAAVYLLVKAFFWLRDSAMQTKLDGFAADAENTQKRIAAMQSANASKYQGIEKDASTLSYFAEMSKNVGLTASQMQECSKAMQNLQNNGIDLGYSIDETTGKLVKMEGSYKSLTEQLNEKKKADLRQQMDLLRKGIERRSNETSELLEDSHWYKANKQANAQAIAELDREIGDMQDKYDQLFEQWQVLNNEQVSGPDISKITAIEQDILAMKETNLQRELRINEEKKKSALDVVDAQITAAEMEREALAKKGEDTSKSDSVIDDMKKRRAAIESAYGQNHAKLVADAAKSAGVIDIKAEGNKREQDRNEKAKEKKDNARLDAMKEANPMAYAAYIQNAMAAVSQQLADAAKNYEDAVAAAQDKSSDSGEEISETEKQGIEAYKTIWEQLQKQQDAYADRMMDMQNGIEKAGAQISSAPMFSSKAVAAAMSGTNSRQLEYSQKTAQNTAQTITAINKLANQIASAGGLAFA